MTQDLIYFTQASLDRNKPHLTTATKTKRSICDTFRTDQFDEHLVDGHGAFVSYFHGNLNPLIYKPTLIRFICSTMEPHRGPRLVLHTHVQIPPEARLQCDDAGGVAAAGAVWLCRRARGLLIPLRQLSRSLSVSAGQVLIPIIRPGHPTLPLHFQRGRRFQLLQAHNWRRPLRQRSMPGELHPVHVGRPDPVGYLSSPAHLARCPPLCPVLRHQTVLQHRPQDHGRKSREWPWTGTL